MDIKIINVLFTDKMKQGKLLAKKLIELYGKVVELNLLIDKETKSVPSLSGDVQKLLDEEPSQSSVEGWAERIKIFFQTLLSPVDDTIRLVDVATVQLQNRPRENSENGNLPLTKSDLIAMWNAEVLEFEVNQQIRDIDGEPITVFENFKERPAEFLLRMDYELRKGSNRLDMLTYKMNDAAKKQFAETVSQMVLEKTTGRIATKVADQVTENISKVINTQLSNNKKMANEGRLLSKPQNKAPQLGKKRWTQLYLNNEVRCLYIFITFLLLFIVCLGFANGEKTNIINRYESILGYNADKALQFDYIQAVGQATPATLLKLDSIFVTHRLPEAIKRIKEYVANYQTAQKEAINKRIREDLQRKEKWK
ncbi:hypothetical protein [Phocaeicola oris]|uniref:hypothetical protein n=1 Tax=Phocaeicola oris TaxID=2896850 RepID=UPI00234F55D0|nr:hypothetical protein [Phocaeicola oris]MCE2617119.1 hypothetical protein [Phocaeicola oris]